MREPQKKTVLVVALTIIVLLCIILLFVRKYQYEVVFQQAFSNFIQSRKKEFTDLDEFEFQTFGLKYGMTVEEVDQLMAGADEVDGPMRMKRSGLIYGTYEKHYFFLYRPKHTVPFSDETIPLISERFFVFFNDEGKVVSLKRWLFLRGDSNRTGSTTWDLSPEPEI